MIRTSSAFSLSALTLRWRCLLAATLVSLFLFAPVAHVGAAVVEHPQAIGLLAPADWDMMPTGWTSTRAMYATVIDNDGLQESTAEYRYSTDGGVNWTNWSADAALEHSSPIATTVHFTVTIPALVESGTLNKVQLRLQDEALALEASPTHPLAIDSQLPGSPINLTVNPAGWTSTNTFDLSWMNPVQTGSPVYRAYYKFDSAPTSVSDYTGYREGANIYRIDDLSVPHGGATPCYIWLGDAAGNADHTAYQNITLYFSGGSAPEPPFAMQIAPNGWVSGCVYTVNWTNPSSPSGIAAAWYKWGTAPAHSSDGTRVVGANIQILTNLTPPGQGQHDLHVWLEDGAGSKDQSNRRTVQALCDTAVPSTTSSLNPPLPPSGWYGGAVTTVTVNLSPQDNLSGIQDTRWRRGSGLWNSGTSFVADSYLPYSYYSIDNAGNIEATQTVTVPIDLEPPVSAIATSPSAPTGGWYSQTVTVTITAADALSGWAGGSWYRVGGSGAFSSGTTATIATSGVHMFEYYSTDRAGNIEATRLVTPVCRIDLEAPIASATPSATGAYVQPPIVITFTASDLHSGVKAVEYRPTGSATWITSTATVSVTVWGDQGDKAYVYEYRARDQVGNVSSVQAISVNVDGTAPLPPTGLVATPSGWTNLNGNFGLTWANPNDFSGIAGVYYQLDVTPTVTLSPTYVAGAGINSLANRSVSGEGQHAIYIWLQDGAGNSERFHYQVLPHAFKYDATPPQCDPLIKQGTLGSNGFYTAPVTVTLAAHDALSGLAAYHYRINASNWVTVPISSASMVFSQDDRYIINYRASDLAGNIQATPCQDTIWVDATAAASPISPLVTPSDWTRTNSYNVTWTNPTDAPAGIAAAYLKKSAPPASGRDGQRFESGGITSITGLTADSEGETSAYVWLEDRAGNINHANRVLVTLRYDRTPPTSTLAIEGTLGRNGFYTTPVTLRFNTVDAASGVAAIYYRLNGGAEQVWDGSGIVLNQEGEYTVTFRATDRAGNSEQPANQQVIKLDLNAPTGSLRVPSQYTTASSTFVEWSGADSQQGSGVEKYAVEYRIGGCSPWQAWLADTAATSGTFNDLWINQFYHFRVRAIDYAGNMSAWSDPDADDYVYREGLINPSFDSCSLTPWITGGALPVTAANATAHDDTLSCMTRLSKERWAGNPPQDPPIGVPVNGYGLVWQAIQLPLRECDRGLMLSFWYRVQTFDVAWGLVQGGYTPDPSDDVYGWIDTFDVAISDASGQELALVLRDGNFGAPNPPDGPYQAFDLGWKQAWVDLTPWAGQQVRIEFRVWNRVDQFYPTWAFVDDVKLAPVQGERLSLPVILKNAGMLSAPAMMQEQPAAASPQAKDLSRDNPPKRK